MKKCNFCGRTEDKVKRMITAKHGDICAGCVLTCLEALLEDPTLDFKEIPFKNTQKVYCKDCVGCETERSKDDDTTPFICSSFVPRL